MAADLGLMVGTSSVLTVPSNTLLSGTTAVENYVAGHLAPGGRFAFYDPQGYASGITAADTGRPDANVLARLPSVGGYASIVDGSYNAATLTHTQGELNVPRLASGGFTQLDLQDILTVPEYFLVPLTTAPTNLAEVSQASEARGQDAVLPLGNRANFSDSGYSFYPAPRGELGAGQSSRWFFGEVARGVACERAAGSGRHVGADPLRHRDLHREHQVGAAGSVDPGARRVGSRLPAGAAVGLVVQVVSGRLPPHQAVIVVGTQTYELDGALSSAVQPGPWRQQGSVDRYTLYVRSAGSGVRLCGHAGTTTRPPRSRCSRRATTPRPFAVHATAPVVVVRNVAWDGGWRASVSSNGGPEVTVPVDKRGLVQQVALPAGTDVVRFSYQPRHWLVASVLSEGAALLLLLLLVDIALRRWSSSLEPPPARAPRCSAEGVGQREEEFPFVGPPHVIDHESRRAELLLDPGRR